MTAAVLNFNESAATPTVGQRLLALFITSLTFVVVYNGTNYITAQRLLGGAAIGTAAFSWERWIPFVPWMVVPYWSIDLFFLAAPFVAKTKIQLRLLVLRICCGVIVAGVFFLWFPLRLAFLRPPVEPPLLLLFDALDNFNNFYNLAPSLHIILRSILWTVYIPAVHGAVRRILQFWFALIGLSTLLVYQHHFIDVFTGQIIGLLVIQITDLLQPHLPAAVVRGVPERRVNSRTDLAVKYLAAAVLLASAPILFGIGAIVLLWPAAALFAVSLGYFGLGPGVFAKADGRIGLGSTVLFLPYFAGRSISFYYFTRQIRPFAQISDRLYFGRRITSAEIADLPDGITSVLDLTAEYEEAKALLSRRYCNIQILDLTAPSELQLKAAVDWIGREIVDGRIYLHCSLGLSRSAIVAAAWLVKSGAAVDLDQAILRIREIRPEVVLQTWQLDALRRFIGADH